MSREGCLAAVGERDWGCPEPASRPHPLQKMSQGDS